jgi:hypothetical protein
MKLRPISEAPAGLKLVAWCDHEADPYQDPHDDNRLTTYGAHVEGMSHAKDGWNVVEWLPGQFYGNAMAGEPEYYMEAWWFVHGTDGEVAANPIGWVLALPDKPDEEAA